MRVKQPKYRSDGEAALVKIRGLVSQSTDQMLKRPKYRSEVDAAKVQIRG